ncbi:MAG: hypothetical protein AAGA58_15870 [Verrucomicrobiota bacterium]
MKFFLKKSGCKDACPAGVLSRCPVVFQNAPDRAKREKILSILPELGTCSVTLQCPGSSIQGKVSLDSCYAESSEEDANRRNLLLRLDSLLRDCSALKIGGEQNLIEIEAGCHAARILIYPEQPFILPILAEMLDSESSGESVAAPVPPDVWLDEFPHMENANVLDAENQFQRILQLVRDSRPIFFHFRTAVASWTQSFSQGIWDRIGNIAVFKANGGENSVYFDLTSPCLTVADDGTPKFLLGSA